MNALPHPTARREVMRCPRRYVCSSIRGSHCELHAERRAASGPVGADRLAVPTRDRVMIIRVADIDWIQASDNYVDIHVGRKSWLLRETISTLDRRLTPSGFVRIHRSTIVNSQRVTELQSLANGEFSVVLTDGTVLRMSKSYRGAFDQLIGNVR